MGCLNYDKGFSHWFGNIHLSGPCNRSCYFCVGQHMMAQDPYNVLDTFPLPNLDEFIFKCLEHNVTEINITGSNTDPLLYKHTKELKDQLSKGIPNLTLGVRTNGALILEKLEVWNLYDKASISFPSFDTNIYEKMMGSPGVPNLYEILKVSKKPIKINMVLGPENLAPGPASTGKDLYDTIKILNALGIKKINLREPYGQPHLGDPLVEALKEAKHLERIGSVYGMPLYNYLGTEIVYWDVHYVEVESVNLYANGTISVFYPITKGCDPKEGKVIPQDQWIKSGRQAEQWLTYK